jgi:CTP:molybdopterin cytidylyltransferase MocA
MHCVIAAGGVPRADDPLYSYTQGKPKALIELNGRKMLERVVDALHNSRYVEEVVVVGLADAEYENELTFQRPVRHLPDHGSLVANVLAGIALVRQEYPETREVLLTSSDLPLLTGAIVDDFVETCRQHPAALHYTFVRQEDMERRFPNSQRTFVPLKDMRIAGGDLFLSQVDLAESHPELWHTLTNARKHAWRLAWTVGLLTLLRFFLRRMAVAEVEATASRMVRRQVKVIVYPQAELAMDVDKPHHVDIVRADLARQAMGKVP